MPSAKLTVSGVTFGDSTVLSSKYGIVPQSSVAVFFQSSAPTGWTKSTANNDKALRVVSGAAGGSAGGVPADRARRPGSTLSEGQLPSHTHPNGGFVGLSPGGGDVAGGAGWSRSSPITGPGPAVGTGAAHSHPFSGTASFTSSFDLRLQYIDVIICSFN